MQPKFNLKIQVKAKASNDQCELPWADLEAMPEFTAYAQAHQWLIDNGAMELCKYGLDFRIVPEDFPCIYTVALENHLKASVVQ